ncbi:MAG: preprotein translocase subunit SecE [Eubacterium sp.]|nr:preprotein translocase subunit SecE [Eubacterium sp.]
MAKNKGEGKFKTWWKGLKSEFSKIIWLNRKTVIKQTVIVIVVTVIVGVLITVIDFYCQLGLQQIVSKAMKQDTTTTAAQQQEQQASQQAVTQAVTKAQKANKAKKADTKKADTKKTDKKSAK